MPALIRIAFQVAARGVVLAGTALTSWLGLTDVSPATEARIAQTQEAAAEHTERVIERLDDAGVRDIHTEAEPVAPTVAVPPAEVVKPKPVVPAAPPAPSPAPRPTPVVPEPAPAPTREPEEEEPEAEEEPRLTEENLPGIIEEDVDEEPERDLERDDASLARETTVNVVCLRAVPGGTAMTSGSGVVISPDGLVVTNAHVARLFVLGDDVSCSVTHPSMPVLGHRASLVYVSPDWLREHGASSRGVGTGEEDYAFVSIDETAFTPSRFDHAPVDAGEVSVGDDVTVAGYPGSPRSLLDFGARARFQVDDVSVADIFSFGGGSTPDVILTGRTPLAAEGASGGGVFRDGEVVGIIAAAISGRSGASASAISFSYINRDLRRDIGVSVAELARADYAEVAEAFLDEHADLARLVERSL